MRIVCFTLLALSFFSGCGERSKAPQAFIEDGTPAVEKEEDKVTKEARKFFTTWLRGHDEKHIVDDSTGVGIESSKTRLWAFLYESSETENGYFVETEFRIVLPDGREIVEFLAGNGKTEDEAIGMTFMNFMMSTFHVAYSCFMNESDPHLIHEEVTIGGKKCRVTTGGIFALGGAEVLPDFSSISDQIVELIATDASLSGGTHWIKVVYGQVDNQPSVIAATLDNEDYEWLSEEMAGLPWPKTNDFYMAKQFIVIRPVAKTSP